MADTNEHSKSTGTTVQEVNIQQTFDGKLAHGKPPQKPHTGDQILDSPSKSATNGTGSLDVNSSTRQRHGTNERKDATSGSSQDNKSAAADKNAVNGSANAHVANDDAVGTAAAGGRTSPTRQSHAAAAGDLHSAASTAGDSGSKKRSADQTTTNESGRRSRTSGTASNIEGGSGAHSDATINDPEKSAETDVGKDLSSSSKRAKVDEPNAPTSRPPTIAGGDEDKGPISTSGVAGSGVATAAATAGSGDVSAKLHSDSSHAGGAGAASAAVPKTDTSV